MINGELIVDNFAGGGGASTGIEMATGISVDIAINHDPEAIRMHKTNHPNTRHYCESVWDVDPVKACKGHPVGLAWFSPDCKHFSKAKGGKPKDKNIRGLAWVTLRWAGKVRPRVIMLENVEECLEVLKREKKNSPRSNIKATREQAERVAWRILKDWIEAQMALLDIEMVRFEEIFLPYIETQNGKTIYEQLEEKKFLLEG